LTPAPDGCLVALGEAMIRLSPPGHERLEQARSLEVDVGGAELNALIAFTRLGGRAKWVSRLPATALGRRIQAHALAHRVEAVIDWEPAGRTGIYFVERGAIPRPGEVLYERAGSAAAGLSPGQFDWPAVLAGAAGFHTTGITLALGDGPRAAALEALAIARRQGLTTGFDLNHRTRLWPPEQAVRAVREALPLVDIFFATAFDLRLVLGSDEEPVTLARAVRQRFGVRVVVIGARRQLGALLVEQQVTVVGDQVGSSSGYQAEVVDPVGAGDALAGAFWAAWLAGSDLGRAADLAARAAALKHTIPGDVLVADAEDLEALGSNPTRRSVIR